MAVFTGIAAGVFALPIFALFGAFFRALILFWPTMLLLGAVHTHLAYVPPLGAAATFLVVALLSLLIPTNTNTNND